MAPGSRLEELTAKYMQNPRRFFVPLANEYRQSNDLDRAIALCREHLPAQPGHMSGHIVLGRAYFEKGDIDAAREVFLTSVALDDENAIALRHLGDIARLRGEPAEARQWYARVLDADPENAEIERLLRSMGGAVPTPPGPIAVMPGAPLGGPPPSAGMLTATLRPPSTFELADAAEALADPTPPGLKAIFGESEELPGAVADGPPPPALTFLEDTDAAVAADATGTVDSDVLATPQGMGFRFDDLDELTGPATVPLAPHVTDVLPPVDEADFSNGIGTPPAAMPPVSTPVEEDTTAPADDLLSRPAFGALASFASWRTARERETPAAGQPAISPTPAPEPESLGDLSDGVQFDEMVVADATPTAPEFVTETMAQLYVQQGFLPQALDVYRELAYRDPRNAGFAARISELEAMVAHDPAAAALEADADHALDFDEPAPEERAEAEPVSILELMYDVSPPAVRTEGAEGVTQTWGSTPPATDDDWFADIDGDAVVTETVSVDEGFYGVSMDGFGVPSEAESFDAAFAAATAPVSLASVFGPGTVIPPADENASALLVALAGQMVGRLPKELPALPVPDVLDLPTAMPGEESHGASPAPLLSFDRFFSGSGSPPRARLDDGPMAAPVASSSAAPVVPPPSPSLSPTFGGVPVIPPPPPAATQPWAAFERQAAEPPLSPVAPSAPPPTVPRDTTPVSGLPAWMQVTPEMPADAVLPAPEPVMPVTPVPPAPPEPLVAEPPPSPPRDAPSEFHRWLEGLS
ncbi:MAG: tetratricopeptide repeat protein [Gemmatimonadaceae bacterium]|nr:tetratricopeptide repeat protein [Gemmatimonadaceae bacterium]